MFNKASFSISLKLISGCQLDDRAKQAKHLRAAEEEGHLWQLIPVNLGVTLTDMAAFLQPIVLPMNFLLYK